MQMSDGRSVGSHFVIFQLMKLIELIKVQEGSGKVIEGSGKVI